jgi:hypothetical protein
MKRLEDEVGTEQAQEEVEQKECPDLPQISALQAHFAKEISLGGIVSRRARGRGERPHG